MRYFLGVSTISLFVGIKLFFAVTLSKLFIVELILSFGTLPKCGGVLRCSLIS